MRLLNEIYNYRQMIFSMVRKDLRGRYKGSALGFLWTFLNPLLQLIVYTFVFSIVLRADIDKFYLFLFVALVPWIFFSSSIITGCTCILAQKDLVKKIYFPRQVLPIAYVTSSFINMLFSFIVIFFVLIVSGHGVNWSALCYLPLIMCVEYVLALGMALIFSALNVFFRDLEHILGIVVMAWMYLTPIMYKAEQVPIQFRSLFYMNPMTPIVIAYRDILYYKQIPHIELLVKAGLLGVGLLIAGMIIFQVLQKFFAEEL
jgi:lipopolysaccharide transport system permease protein